MKIKLKNLKVGQKFVHRKKYVNEGDEIDVSKERAGELISRGLAEEVKEAPKKTDKKSE